MTYDEKIDGLDAIIQDLVEWELSNMDFTSLEDFFIEEKREYYLEYPDALENMLKYREEYKDTETVLTPRFTYKVDQHENK